MIMKNRWKLSATAAAVLIPALLLGAGAKAETITFGTNAGAQNIYQIGPTYTEQGYTFTAAAGKQLATSGNGQALDPDPTSSVTLVGNSTVEAITMTLSDHGTFNLKSIDFQGEPSPGANGKGNIILFWVDGNGIGGLDTFSVLSDSWSTDLLSLTDLRSISWIPGGDINNPNFAINQNYFVWADNVVVSSTPIPAALPLFISALGVLGFAARRRRKQA
jgi:hypothetical protein